MKHVFEEDHPVIAREFTLARARLVLNCREDYDVPTIRRAAIWMLGSLEADDGDMEIARGILL